jgi:hypothetical protein
MLAGLRVPAGTAPERHRTNPLERRNGHVTRVAGGKRHRPPPRPPSAGSRALLLQPNDGRAVPRARDLTQAAVAGRDRIRSSA